MKWKIICATQKNNEQSTIDGSDILNGRMLIVRAGNDPRYMRNAK